MIDLASAMKIMSSIPPDTLLNFPHPNEKLAISYSWEDTDYYIFDIFSIPQTRCFKDMADELKDKYYVISWRVSKRTGQAEEWTE